MLFVLNSDNYGLKINDGIELDVERLKENGVKFFDSENELNLALCEVQGLSLEEVEGCLPLIIRNICRHGSYFHVCDRGILSDIEEPDLSKYISEYIL